jgi:hypothetical protein
VKRRTTAKPEIVRGVWRVLYVGLEVEGDGAAEAGLILVSGWVLGTCWLELILLLYRRRFMKARDVK